MTFITQKLVTQQHVKCCLCVAHDGNGIYDSRKELNWRKWFTPFPSVNRSWKSNGKWAQQKLQTQNHTLSWPPSLLFWVSAFPIRMLLQIAKSYTTQLCEAYGNFFDIIIKIILSKLYIGMLVLKLTALHFSCETSISNAFHEIQRYVKLFLYVAFVGFCFHHRHQFQIIAANRSE